MSNSSLIPWFEQLLFGSKDLRLLEPPDELFLIIAKLQAERVDWREMARLGGLTIHRYQIQCDFDALFDYFEKPTDTLPTMKTRSMTTFFNLLLAHMARRDAKSTDNIDDKITLERLLSDPNTSGPYVSASFWGSLAKQYLNNRRPVPDTMVPLSSKTPVDRANRLYDVTCYTRGRWIDPFSMHMIPDTEYVNAVHWQSGSHLEALVRTKPDHVLSRAVRDVVRKSLHQFLAGQYPACLLEKDDKIQTFLRNVSVAHDTVPQVNLTKSPPRLIDVFQRLLAMAQVDDLWERVPERSLMEHPHTQMMQMTEQLLLAERQNRILLKHCH